MPKMGRKSKKGKAAAAEMDLPPEEAAAPAPAPKTTKVPEGRPPKAASAAATRAVSVDKVQTDLSYLDRPPAFFTRTPDSEGPVEKSFEDYWIGQTMKAQVMVKKFPGVTQWEPRMAMLIPTELTLRDMNKNELVQNCIKRGEVSADQGVEVQNSKVDPNNYESSDYGFKITATDFTGGEDVIFLIKFVSGAKESQEAWKGAFKKNGWESFK